MSFALPIVGGSTNTWGATLNTYILAATHGVFTPELYGAAGNGIADDTTAINNAVTAAAGVGRVVLSATYGISGAITLATNTNFVQVSGGGLVALSSLANMVTATSVSNVTVRDVTLTTNSHVTGLGVGFTSVTTGEISGCSIVDAAHVLAPAVQTDGCTDVVIKNNRVDGAVNGIIVTNACFYVKVIGNRLRHTKNRAIYITGTTAGPTDTTVEENICTDVDLAGTVRVYIQGGPGVGLRLTRLSIRRNICVGPNGSFTAGTGTADQITCVQTDGLTIEDNVSVYGGDAGISGSNNTNETVVGNFCAYNDTVGLFVGSTPTAVTTATVTGNTFINNGQNRNSDRASSGRAGLFCHITGGIVDGNNVGDNQGSPTQQYGIVYVNSTSLIIGPNIGVGNVVALVLDNGGNTLLQSTLTAVATGTAVLVGGTKAVSNASITANSQIRLTYQTIGGTPGAVFVSARAVGTSFTITSTSGTDTSTIFYEILAF